MIQKERAEERRGGRKIKAHIFQKKEQERETYVTLINGRE